MPIWNHPATFQEIHSLLCEKRATVGRRTVRDGLDFSRAVASVGINRGISAFQRYVRRRSPHLRARSCSPTPRPRGTSSDRLPVIPLPDKLADVA